MIIKNLDGEWELKKCGEDWQRAAVPGTVYTSLYENGRIPDPFWKDNEDVVCALMEDGYEYRLRTELPDELRELESVILHFDGIDTLAEIFVNGRSVGKAENMHRVWEYEVAQALKPGINEFLVRLYSPLAYIAAAYKKYGNIGNDDTFEGFMHLRKAHYMFGWDWGAHLPDAGIFRSVSLMGIRGGRLSDVHIRQRHADGAVALSFKAAVESDSPFVLRAEVQSPDGKSYCADFDKEGRAEILISDPHLWWPNGLGDQPLYGVCVRLSDAQTGNEWDCWQKRIGLRTMTMRRVKDEYGECFCHEVNGRAVFAMGADYIPEDHLLGRRSREKTRRLLEDSRLANFNCVRVWGGGLYPDDWFYDICDELGLIVWQDFMFACSVYELTAEFEENIRSECADVVRRLRHHASLGLWCGNNEMEMFVDERCWVTKATEVRDYLFMYERIIPEVLRTHDPDTFYWPASPSSGGSFDNPNDPDRGDVHYWKVWHGNRPFSEYRKFFFRYASEFGFQSFPSQHTLECITDNAEDLNPFSYIMEKHQRNYGANGKIMNYMQQMYRYPLDFSSFIYASQLLQADAIRYGVEHFRRNRGDERCMGAVYWQLNDCWPVISWSSIDYCGRWKALHYFAKRFFAPVLLSCHEEGWMTAEANMNRQHFAFEKSIRLNAVNETLEERRLCVRWQLRGADGRLLTREIHDAEGRPVKNGGEVMLTVSPLSAVWLDKICFSDIDVFSEYVSYEALEDGKPVSSGTVIFSYPKYFRYLNPALSYEIAGNVIRVRAEAYARSVEILNEAEDLLLSDNYFDMNAGVRELTILRGKPEGIRLRSVYDIGR